MPQLAPMNWLLLMFFFWTLFVTIMIFFWWNKDKKYEIYISEGAEKEDVAWAW